MKKLPGEKTRGGIVPKPGTKCGVCGRPASFECSCGCGAAGCRQCVRDGRIR